MFPSSASCETVSTIFKKCDFCLLFHFFFCLFTFVSECKYNQTYCFLFPIVFHASYIAVLISKVSNRTLTAHFGLSSLASFFDCVRL